MVYLITGNDSYLTDFENNSFDFDTGINNLKNDIKDNEEQVEKLSQIQWLKEDWIVNAAMPEINERKLANDNEFSLDYFKVLMNDGDGQRLMFLFLAAVENMEKSYSDREDFQNQLLVTQLSRAVIDQANGQRGFLITGNENYLASYNQRQSEILRLLEKLKTVVEDDKLNHSVLIQ